MQEDGNLQDVYATLVGAGRYMRHFLGLRKAGPNVALIADPGQGPSDSFLRLEVRTRNNVGIAVRSMVVANFSLERDFSIPNKRLAPYPYAFLTHRFGKAHGMGLTKPVGQRSVGVRGMAPQLYNSIGPLCPQGWEGLESPKPLNFIGFGPTAACPLA